MKFVIICPWAQATHQTLLLCLAAWRILHGLKLAAVFLPLKLGPPAVVTLQTPAKAGKRRPALPCASHWTNQGETFFFFIGVSSALCFSTSWQRSEWPETFMGFLLTLSCKVEGKDHLQMTGCIVKAHMGDGILCLCGVKVHLESGGRMKRVSLFPNIYVKVI